MRTYDVRVTRDDGLWSAVVNGLPANTFAGYEFEHFEDVFDGVREGLADLLGRADFDLDWTFASAEHDYTKSLHEVLNAADFMDSVRRQLDTARKDAISDMRMAGLSYRDIADALGLSHQRVAQLNDGARTP